MSIEHEVDGSFFTFPDGWVVEKVDEWPEQKKLTRDPFHSKACDLVAIKDGALWFIEVKDYTYPGGRLPDKLAQTVGLKVFHTLAILHAVAQWGEGDRREFSLLVGDAQEARICLAVELPDGGRKLQALATPLAALQDKLKKVTRLLNVNRPIVSNSHQLNGVPWTVRRDPETRSRHDDR